MSSARLVLSVNIDKVLQEFLKSHENKEINLKSQIEKDISSEDKTISASLLREVCDYLRKINKNQNQSGPWFHEVIRGSEMKLKSPKPREPTPKTKEYLKRVEEIKRQCENEEYSKMVKNIVSGDPFPQQQQQKGKVKSENEWHAMFNFLSVGSNVLIAMATCFVAFYFIGRQAWGDEVKAILFGLFGLIAAMLVESLLFMIRSSQFD